MQLGELLTGVWQKRQQFTYQNEVQRTNPGTAQPGTFPGIPEHVKAESVHIVMKFYKVIFPRNFNIFFFSSELKRKCQAKRIVKTKYIIDGKKPPEFACKSEV